MDSALAQSHEPDDDPEVDALLSPMRPSLPIGGHEAAIRHISGLIRQAVSCLGASWRQSC
jgi:hypothetical protein